MFYKNKKVIGVFPIKVGENLMLFYQIYIVDCGCAYKHKIPKSQITICGKHKE